MIEPWMIDEKTIAQFEKNLAAFENAYLPLSAKNTELIKGFDENRTALVYDFLQLLKLIKLLIADKVGKETLTIDHHKQLLEEKTNYLKVYIEKLLYKLEKHAATISDLNDKCKNLKQLNSLMCDEVRTLMMPESEIIESLNNKISELNELIAEKDSLIDKNEMEILFLKRTIDKFSNTKRKQK